METQEGGMPASPNKVSASRQRSAATANFETRAHVLQVVSRCLDDIPLEKLSISTICERAGISRPTFYRYFSDRYDVFNWLLRTNMTASIAQVGVKFPWRMAITKFCSSMDANRGLASKYLADRSAFSSYEKFIGYLQKALLKSAALRYPSAEEVPLRIRFQAIAFSRAFAAAFADWLDGEKNHDISIDEFVDCSLSIVPSDLFALLDRDPDGSELTASSLQASDRSPLIEFVAEENPQTLE